MQSEDRAALVADLFDTAIEHDTTRRQAFLDQRCGSDVQLRHEVESLLRAAKRTDGFMEVSLVAKPFEIDRASGSFAAGQTVAEYEIVSLIGKGGMGEVYLARDQRVARRVALKLVRGGLDRDLLTRRFQREQQLLAGLNHPNIAQLYETGVSESGIPYFVMEFVEGERLDRFVVERGLGLEESLKLFRKVCGAVAYAHRHLVVHRDIKPANIRVTADGEPKLLDFGIAKLLDEMNDEAPEQTLTAHRMLTPEYASPEQLRGEPISTATDVYSLGVVFYELLTGAKPYRLTSRRLEEITRAITEQEPTRPSATATANAKALRGDLDNIMLMAVRKEPERRYPSAAQFSDDICRYLEGRPIRARKDTVGYRTGKFIRRNRTGVAAAALVFVTLAGGIIASTYQARRAQREARRAQGRFDDVRQIANSLLFEVEGELEKGPTKAREKLVTHAVAYLDRLASEVTNDPALQMEVAAGYLKVGDIQGRPFYANIGDATDALASYAKAVHILETLAASPRSPPGAVRYLSQAWQSIGRVQRRDGNWIEALDSSRKAVALAERLVETQPGNDAYRSLLAVDYIHLGTALYKTEYAHTAAELTEALGYYRKALSIQRQLMGANPRNSEYRAATAEGYFWVGLALWALGDLTGGRENQERALENFVAQVELDTALLQSDPSNRRYRRAWADAIISLSHQQNELGQAAEMDAKVREAFGVFESIVAADPANVEARRDLAIAQLLVTEHTAATGDVTGAANLAAKAFSLLQQLVQEEPNSGDAVFTAIRCCHRLASLEKALGRYDAALEASKIALRIAQEWLGKRPGDIPASRLTGITLVAMGELYEAMRDWPAAKEAYQQGETFWRQVPDTVLRPADRATKNELGGRVLRCERATTEPH